MTDSDTRRAEPEQRRRRPMGAVALVVLFILFAVPCWIIVYSGAQWPLAVRIIGTVVFLAALIALPTFMVRGHGRRGSDAAARIGDTLLGLVWIVFVWSILSYVLRLVLLIAGVDDPQRSRIVSIAAVVVIAVIALWGHYEAMRVPRIKNVEIGIPRLGGSFDGLRVVLLTDTHFGPINRTKWSTGVVAAVNTLNADIVCHIGDIADGSVDKRREMAAPLETVRAGLAKVYVTGNHEYFGEAQAWLDHMEHLGWTPLHNRHLIVEQGSDKLVIAGVDDRTARGSGTEGHGADYAKALAGADDELPVLMLSHQPKQIDNSVAAGVDLQVAGHTHGGQIWPFNFLVRLDQPVVHGLSRHGERTQLYTSRGSGFWGPPFRVFAPSEITVITLRSAHVRP